MSAPSAWKTLSTSPRAAGVVLAVDFDTTGRAEARFTDLVQQLSGDFTVWESAPPPGGSAAGRHGPDYVDHWAGAITPDGPRVDAVMGFCGGAVFAAALAERVWRVQGSDPALILLDPEISTAQTLIWQFHKVIGFMTGILGAEQVAGAQALGQQAYERITDVVPLKDELMRLMRQSGEPALAAAGLDQAHRQELVDVFDAFMCYLAAASELDPTEAWQSAVALSSSSPLSGLNALRAAGDPNRTWVGKELRFEVDHGTMLADPEVAATVSDLLRG